MTDGPSKNEFDALKARVAALESLVIDLLALNHELAPAGLGEHLAADPLRISGNELVPLTKTAALRRDQLIAAAGVQRLG